MVVLMPPNSQWVAFAGAALLNPVVANYIPS